MDIAINKLFCFSNILYCLITMIKELFPCKTGFLFKDIQDLWRNLIYWQKYINVFLKYKIIIHLTVLITRVRLNHKPGHISP